MKKFDWEEFNFYGVAVHCKNKVEENDFFKNAKKHGIKNNVYNFISSDNNYYVAIFNFSVMDGNINSNSIVKTNKTGGYKILEWSDYMEFSKEDLKVGMLVETNHGRALVMPFKYGYVLAYKSGGFDKWDNVKLEEINKVWDVCNIQEGVLGFNEALRPLLYERLQAKEMTVEEISKALGYDVKIVK